MAKKVRIGNKYRPVLTRHIEKAGTGILDMIGLCVKPPSCVPQNSGKRAGNSFRLSGDLKLLLWAQSEAQSGARLISVMKAIRNAPLSSNELMRALGMKSKTGALKRTIAQLLADGLIEYTIPEKAQQSPSEIPPDPTRAGTTRPRVAVNDAKVTKIPQHHLIETSP